MKKINSSKTLKRVSYILATKDRPDRLNRTLTELKRLIRSRDELIVVDGGNDKETLAIVNKHKKIIDRFLREPDVNSAHAVNKGFMLAQGKYVKDIADDDTLYPEAVGKAVKVMDKHPEIDVLVCGGTYNYEGSKVKLVNYVPPGQNFGKSIFDVFSFGACGMGFLIRRSSLAKLGLYPISPIADVEFIVNCIKNNLIVRFCRINMYHATIFKHSAVIRKKDEVASAVKKLVVNNSSYFYYYKRRLKDLIWSYTRYKPVLILVTLAADSLHTLRDRKNHFVPKKRPKYIWDGGFS